MLQRVIEVKQEYAIIKIGARVQGFDIGTYIDKGHPLKGKFILQTLYMKHVRQRDKADQTYHF